MYFDKWDGVKAAQELSDYFKTILKRYRELGGEILTLGSDAHQPEHVAYDFFRLKKILWETGFTHFTVFKGRKPIFLEIK